MNCSVSGVSHFDVTSSNLVDPSSQKSFEPFKFNEVTLWYPFAVQGLAGGSGPEKHSITNPEVSNGLYIYRHGVRKYPYDSYQKQNILREYSLSNVTKDIMLSFIKSQAAPPRTEVDLPSCISRTSSLLRYMFIHLNFVSLK